MSLINDVLKDLERRRASPDQAAPQPAAARQTGPGRRLPRWPLWLLAAVATGAVLHLSLDSADPPARPGQPEPFVAQAEPGAASRSPAAPVDGTQINPATAPPDGRAAATALPVETTAEPETREASLPEEASRQTARADEPDRDLDAGRSPGSESTSAARLEAEPEDESKDEPESDSESASRGDSEAAPDPRPGPEDGPDSGADPAATQNAEPTISIRRSGDDGGETAEALAGAKRMLARGQVERAESRLRPLIRQRPELTEAHELLARALVQRGLPGQATEALEAGLAQAANPERLATLLGRLLIERGEIARARSILAEHAPPLADAPAHHLLLAAAQRQSGDHEAAAEHYRRLSEILPRRGAVWIGLGASLESLDRPAEAATAYNRALDSDDGRAVRFARQRLDALEPLIGEPQ